MQVSSAFSQLLNLHNLSEEISSAQLERAVRMGEVRAEREKEETGRTFQHTRPFWRGSSPTAVAHAPGGRTACLGMLLLANA